MMLALGSAVLGEGLPSILGEGLPSILGEGLLGDDLLLFLVMAMGAALFLGNVLALIKPPPRPKEGELARAPKGRTLLMALIGFVALMWSLGSIVAK